MPIAPRNYRDTWVQTQVHTSEVPKVLQGNALEHKGKIEWGKSGVLRSATLFYRTLH